MHPARFAAQTEIVMSFYFCLSLLYLFGLSVAPPRFFTMTCLMGLVATYQAFQQSSARRDLSGAAVTGLLPLVAFLLFYNLIGMLHGGTEIESVIFRSAPLVVCYLLGFFCPAEFRSHQPQPDHWNRQRAASRRGR